jgi:hypothetical protein
VAAHPTTHPLRRPRTWSAAVAIAIAAALLSGCVTGGGKAATAPATLLVSPLGADTSPCTAAAPCLSFDRAYHVAKPGQVVELAAGDYGSQEIFADGSKTSPTDVVFRPQAGAAVTLTGGLDVHGSHVAFERLTVNGHWQTFHETDDVTFRGVTVNGVILTQSSSNISILGGSVGGAVDTKPQIGAWPPSTTNRNILIDGVVFHDVTRTAEDQHVECLLVAGIDGLVIRNSRFLNCAVFDLSLGEMNGSPPPNNITIENNFFAAANGFYSLSFNDNSTGFSNVLIRNNSSAQAMYLGKDIKSLTNVRVVANIAPNAQYACDSRIAYSYNVWQGARCGKTDLNAPLGFRDPDTFDFHLLPGARAIGHGDPKSYPAKDIDGKKRPQGKRVDAGAAERP